MNRCPDARTHGHTNARARTESHNIRCFSATRRDGRPRADLGRVDRPGADTTPHSQRATSSSAGGDDVQVEPQTVLLLLLLRLSFLETTQQYYEY